MTSLEGKVALVTGGARKIGLAIARKLASQGARVAIADLDGEAAEAAAKTLRGDGGAIGLTLDVGSAVSIRALMDQLDERCGRVDILVNNAGGATNAPFLEMLMDDWEYALRLNVTGPFLISQEAARRMVASGNGGAIVNITSVSAQLAGEIRTAYGSSKAGLEHLTRQMALELAGFGIRVNAVAPGPIAPEPGRIAHREAERVAYMDRIPMRRFGTPEEVAGCVLFLVSDGSSYVTGHVLNADGGYSIAGMMKRSAE